MKKQLSILMLCLALSSPAFAITCKEGTVIQGKDGREFCSSKIKMNWWSAITWCESQKLSLSSIDACSDFGESYEITGRCHNFISGLDYSTYFWTATSTNKSEALSFRRPDGYTYSAKKGSTAAYALCD